MGDSKQGKPGMTERAVRRLALSRMKTWGLHGWTFEFNNRIATMGLCRFCTEGQGGQIELSRHFIAMNDRLLILDTILHEIAHALAGPTGGHGPVWKAMCRKVGADPVRCSVRHAMPPGKYRATCKRCKCVYDRCRKPVYGRNYLCPKKTCGKAAGSLVFKSGG